LSVRRLNLILLLLFVAAALGGSFTCDDTNHATTLQVVVP